LVSFDGRQRRKLTDEAWEQIGPLLPKNGRRGAQWKDHRKIINGILWKLRTGAPWRVLLLVGEVDAHAALAAPRRRMDVVICEVHRYYPAERYVQGNDSPRLRNVSPVSTERTVTVENDPRTEEVLDGR
jgi:hypothetical protein